MHAEKTPKTAVYARESRIISHKGLKGHQGMPLTEEFMGELVFLIFRARKDYSLFLQDAGGLNPGQTHLDIEQDFIQIRLVPPGQQSFSSYAAFAGLFLL